MQLIHPGPEEAMLCLRAVRSVVARAVGIPPSARAMMTAAQRSVLNTDADLDALAPINPADLAAGISTPGLGDQVIQAMLLGVIADGEPDPACEKRAEAFATALGVSIPGLRTVRLLCEHHMLLFRLDFLRRSSFRDMIIDQYQRHGGIQGVVQALLGMRGLREDPELARRYIALGDLPEDTLGYAFFRHYRDNGFALPGERTGFPEGAVYHDMTHVLSGYGTTVEGETMVGGFTAGYRKVNPFYVLLIPILSFSTGVNITPSDQPHVSATLANPGVAAGFIQAIERGARVNTDLSASWDYWPLVELPLAEARARLAIPPLVETN
jgi:hypothetical protein